MTTKKTAVGSAKPRTGEPKAGEPVSPAKPSKKKPIARPEPIVVGSPLVEVKRALARKYQRLAHNAGSKPRRKVLYNRAEKYRRQVEQLLRT